MRLLTVIIFSFASVSLFAENSEETLVEGSFKQVISPEVSEEAIVALQEGVLLPKIPLETEIKAVELSSVPQKSPNFAAFLSSIIPGLGHTYIKDFRTATEVFGSFSAGLSLASFDKKSYSSVQTGILAATTSSFYGVYAAYRDTRLYNGRRFYLYSMPEDSFADLSYAPFNYKVMKKPEVWGGVLGSLGLATLAGYIMSKGEMSLSPCSLRESKEKTVHVLSAFPVGIGEEAFFRGYLQSSLSETLTPWGGIVASSILFGVAHLPNASALDPHYRKQYYKVSLPLITTLGLYFGWLTHKNHSLKESVAVHAWYDFSLFLLDVALSSSILPEKPSQFSISFSF